jgi:hypothetical protein
MSSTPIHAPASTGVRRSARLAAKPVKNYAPERELPDELLKERTKAMFDTLLTETFEKMNPRCRNYVTTYYPCQKRFLKLFADLPEDDVERIAAENFVKWDLPSDADEYPLCKTLYKTYKLAAKEERETPLKCKKEMLGPSFPALVEKVKEHRKLYNELKKAQKSLHELAMPVVKAMEEESSDYNTLKLKQYLLESSFPEPLLTKDDGCNFTDAEFEEELYEWTALRTTLYKILRGTGRFTTQPIHTCY